MMLLSSPADHRSLNHWWAARSTAAVRRWWWVTWQKWSRIPAPPRAQHQTFRSYCCGGDVDNSILQRTGSRCCSPSAHRCRWETSCRRWWRRQRCRTIAAPATSGRGRPCSHEAAASARIVGALVARASWRRRHGQLLLQLMHRCRRIFASVFPSASRRGGWRRKRASFPRRLRSPVLLHRSRWGPVLAS